LKKRLLKILSILLAVYVLICTLLYVFQENLIFFPEKLNKSFTFYFTQPFEELNIKTQDGILLNGVLLKADSAKGLIFYLHGNAGSIASWGQVAQTYTNLHYDVFMLDYRGYGKSESTISSQQQLFKDVQTAYDTLKTKYTEDKIIVLGYSVGTGPAAKLASANNPKLLILQAPYYSLTDMMRHTYPIIPTFILKYPFETNTFLPQCKMPVVIFHGDEDEVIYYESSVKLKQFFKPGDTLITLSGQGHNGITDNAEYRAAIGEILGK